MKMNRPWLQPIAQALLFAACVVAETSPSAAELPPGLTRFNPAGLPTNWQYETIAFQELRSPVAGLATMAILRLHHPKNGFLLTSSEAEASAAQKVGFVREGTAFFAPAQGGVPVLRFRNTGNNSFFYTASRDEGEKAHFAYDGVAFNAYSASSGLKDIASKSGQSDLVSVARYRETSSDIYLFTSSRESPYEVGVFYFGSFAPSSKAVIEGTQRVYGRKGDWWGGVKDFYGQEKGIPANDRGWSGDWRDLKPEIGYYDQELPETLEQHIRQAYDAGLTFFSFYFYWNKDIRGEMYPEALSSYLRASNSNLIKFNLSLYAHPWDDRMIIGPDNAQEIAERLVSYFKQPQYLRLPDGRPLLVIGDDRNIRLPNGEKCNDAPCYVKSLDTFLKLLKRLSTESLGVAPYVQIQAGPPGWNLGDEVDSVTCLLPPFKLEGVSAYPSLDNSVLNRLNNAGKPVSPCMFENFDERPRQDIVIPDRSAMIYLTDKTDDLFRHNLMIAKQFSDSAAASGKDPVARIIYVYAWNEWHEGGILEPNVHSGAKNLNILTDVFQLPRAPSTCLDHGECKLPQRH